MKRNAPKEDQLAYFRERARVNRQKTRKILNEIKSRGCSRCGEKHPATLQFHHRDPKQKKYTLGQGGTFSVSNLLAEVAKCDLLCANCHKITHWNENGGKF